MPLHGNNLIAGVPVVPGTETFYAFDPRTGERLEPAFGESRIQDVNAALQSAEAAFEVFRKTSAVERASFLERIAEEILALGDPLLQRASAESGLPIDRLTGERGRTVGQLRLFAEVLREGSWCDARIDLALPERAPLPRPDLRRMLLPLGPVAVFGASNFPLAFSVAGGDTASALAAGCPVVVKGHPAHPGTSEWVAGAVNRAAAACGLPAGVFSLLQGSQPEFALALVRHPLTQAVGFTGSHRGGRALLEAANSRPQPIPVFAEMSSLNPIFLLPGALRQKSQEIAAGLKVSVTAGVGQFCTKPGLVFGIGGPDWDAFTEAFQSAIRSVAPGTMLHRGIRDQYCHSVGRTSQAPGVTLLAQSDSDAEETSTQARPSAWKADAQTFFAQPSLQEEIFGPATVLIEASDMGELRLAVSKLSGQLTATVHGTPEDIAAAGPLLEALERVAGRLIINGFPTGVEVSPAMHHGGPYPATTDSRFTAVGTAAIQRWARPVCFQNFPETALPVELRSENPAGLMRTINGKLTRDAIGQ